MTCSLSSYAKAIELIEWGYNRDKERLPQLNLGVVFGEPLSLPLFYTIHQWSIPDVVTLENTIKLAKTFGLKGLLFSEVGFKEKEEAENYLSDQFRKCKNYLGVVKAADRYTIRRKRKAISEAIDRMGKLVLLSNYRIGAKEAIRLYRNKDEIEKFFDNMKNDLSCSRLRVHTTEAAQGRIFVSYISLILYSWINKKMRQGKLFKDYTVQEVMYELKKIKHVQLSKKKHFITELSKKQKEIFKRFGIDFPKITY